MKLVRYLDPETRRVVRIPAAELAPGSVLANIRGVGDGIWIAADALKPGPLRHPPFDEAARVPLREIQIALERVCPTTIEEWEDGFRRDTHPGREIALWLHVARTLQRTMDAGVAADVPQREEAIYRVLVACMTGTREHVRHIHGAAGLSAADVDRIVENYYGPQATLPPPPH